MIMIKYYHLYTKLGLCPNSPSLLYVVIGIGYKTNTTDTMRTMVATNVCCNLASKLVCDLGALDVSVIMSELHQNYHI